MADKTAPELRFAVLDEEDRKAGVPNLADDERLAMMASCVVNQQAAGFRNYIDLRQAACPDCGRAGFNTGWGFFKYVCGAEILSDGEVSEQCCRGVKWNL